VKFFGKLEPVSTQSGGTVRGVNYSASPLLASKAPPGRSRLLVLFVGLAFLGLIVRALVVQVLDAEFFQKKGEERFAATLTLQASRGRILDRNGQLLAVSVSAPTVVVNPRQFKATADQRKSLAELLKLRAGELQSHLDGGGEYVVLRRQVDDGVVKLVKALDIKGLVFEPGYLRRYPENEAAAHLVGFVSVDEQCGEGPKRAQERCGEGIELAYRERLKGHVGTRGVLRDRLGRVVEDMGEPVDPHDGTDVELTIDSKVQALAYQRIRDAVLQHNAKAGSVVVLDALTGEILALANYPSYLPEDRHGRSGEQIRNRAITDVFEPGSTVKPFVVAKALELGFITPDTVFDTNPFNVGPLRVNDGHHSRPSMTVSQIIQKSSNVGTVKISQKLEPREMGELYQALGFGTKPQIGFPGAATGKLRPWRGWKPVEKATMAYGYGLSVSLLQIARAYTALARDGELAPLTLVKGEPAMAVQRIFQPETARVMRQMLRGTVSADGTAPLAQPVGYSAGGKTGTAEKQENGHYNSNKHRAWFSGISPIDAPRVVVAVMVDEPTDVYFGGMVAAPVFKVVVEQALRTLGVPPDMEVKPQVVALANPAAGHSPDRAPGSMNNKVAH